MLCPICGHECQDNSAFCENCGHPLHRPSPVTQFQPQPVSTPVVPQATGELPGKTMGIVGMILGIISIVFGCCAGIFSVPAGIAGIICSALSMKKAKAANRKNNYALAGLICSIVGTVLGFLFIVFLVLMALLEVYG